MNNQLNTEPMKPEKRNPLGLKPDHLELCFDALLYKDRRGYLGEFIQGLIHNINGPLQNMSMLAELTTAGQDRANLFATAHLGDHLDAWKQIHDKQGQRLRQASDQIARVVGMLRDIVLLLELERSETGIDVNLVVTRLMQVLLADLFFKHQVVVEQRLASRLPLAGVPASHFILATVHLFRNAMVAMRESTDKQLTIETFFRDDSVWFILKDTGCGFTSEQTDRLFAPFYSGWALDTAKQDKYDKHLGLGLFMVRMAMLPYGVAVTLERDRKETVACLKLPEARRKD